MTYLLIGLVLFFGLHSISVVAPGWRDSMAERLGLWPWRILHSLFAVASLALLIWGYGQARQDPFILYQAPVWLRHVVAVLMLPVFPLLLASVLPGRIKIAMKFPALVAIKAWALAHLLVNGGVHDLLLFGGFLVWSVAVRISLKRRAPLPIPSAPPSKRNDILAVALGLLVYVAFVKWLHVALIGVVPLP